MTDTSTGEPSSTPPGDAPPAATTTPPAPPAPPAAHHEEPKGDSVADAITALTTTVGELANLIRSQQPVKTDAQPVRRPWTHPAPRGE